MPQIPQAAPGLNPDQAKARLLDALVNNLFPKRIPQAAPGPINLPKITVRPNMAEAAPVQEAMGNQLPSPPVQAPAQAPMPQVEAPKQNNDAIWNFVKAMGIPIASTVAGLANPNFLPGAAGLTTGFNTGMKEAKEFKISQDKMQADQEQNKPSRESLLRMAQNEANRQMGGGVMGQAKMANDPKFKKQYLDLVDSLYRSYLLQFRNEGEVSSEQEIDSNDDLDKEFETYQSGNL